MAVDPRANPREANKRRLLPRVGTPRTAAASKNFRPSSTCELAYTDYYVHARSTVNTCYQLETD
jgi:hypothetical protein